EEVEKAQEKAQLPTPNIPKSQPRPRAKEEESLIEELSKNTMFRQLGRTIFRELTRGILGSFTGKRR
ncbi:helicase HerA-like domain-containing protein, partial [Algoriphagus sp.]|uniref:helicase HerA-like domain-containing protein n=1 Tax=Algoriphagus sp. TaxID=1872435 RepID=UPI0025D55CDB